MKIVTITPHRNRLPQLLNHIRSVGYQTRRPDQVVVSCHGDTDDTRRQVVDWMFEYIGERHIQLWAMGQPSDPWKKPLCLNWAIRRTPEDTDVIVCLDVDCILHPETIAQVEKALQEDPRRFVMCPNHSLSADQVPVGEWTYDELAAKGYFHEWKGKRALIGPPSMSWGCLQAATREWWFTVRGLDEEMQLWGTEDFDVARRAYHTGLKWHWLEMRYKLLHQWHPPGQAGPDVGQDVKDALSRNFEIHRRKHRRAEYVRNPDGWGGRP